MGGRDHSSTCLTCGEERGGMNDLECTCDAARSATKHYAKKRDMLRAVQWINAASWFAVSTLLAPRQVHHNLDTGQLELGNGWYARPTDWILSATGEDITVLSDDVFRRVYEEVDAQTRERPTDAEHEAAGKEFVAKLDTLLATGLRLSPDQHPGIFLERNALVYELRRLLEDHAYVVARRELQRLKDKIARDL